MRKSVRRCYLCLNSAGEKSSLLDTPQEIPDTPVTPRRRTLLSSRIHELNEELQNS